MKKRKLKKYKFSKQNAERSHGKQKIIYYTDELNDEFSTAVIEAKKIDGKYRYVRDGFFARVFSFIIYRLLFMPISYLIIKIKYGFKIKNKKVLKHQKGGYFIYANHTSAGCDPFIPTFVAFPKKIYVIVHAANVSMPILGKINPYLGAIPLPDDAEATRSFLSTIKKRISQNKAICIYPEAHIWPRCTMIRNFKSSSFRYPVQQVSPVYCFTNVYRKRRFFKTPKITAYIDGPFYPDLKLSIPDAKEKLRNEVYSAMKKRSELSDYDGVVYIKKEKEEDEK